jgi:UV DNA damage endonuclease
MIVRLGYVALSIELKNSSPNKTITWKNLQKVDPEYRISRLRLLAKENLKNQLRLLRHNVAEGIQVYRFTSKLIPLATHEVAKDWKFEEDLSEEFAAIGEFADKHRLRVSFHPDHFVNLNSPKLDIVQSSILDLDTHLRQTKAMGLDEKMMFNIHIGGAYQNKQQSIDRLIANWSLLSPEIQRRITLENDDKTYTVRETLGVCQQLEIPMVLDIHHHRCNHDEQDLSSILSAIFNTWNKTVLPPKIHVSSPRGTESSAEFRSHHDYIHPEDLVPFLEMARNHTDALDVMVEAKNKDIALKKLMYDLVKMQGIEKVTEASFRI